MTATIEGMPHGPSAKMQRLAGARLIDTVRIATITKSATVSSTTLLHDEVETNAWQGAALVHRQTEAFVQGQEREFGLRELRIWVAADATPLAGQRCTIVACGDSTLTGEVGSVIDVERATQRAVRRITVRLGDDQ